MSKSCCRDRKRGIGREVALTLARNHFPTFATTRSPDRGENLKHLVEKERLPLKIVQLDVTDDASAKKAV